MNPQSLPMFLWTRHFLDHIHDTTTNEREIESKFFVDYRLPALYNQNRPMRRLEGFRVPAWVPVSSKDKPVSIRVSCTAILSTVMIQYTVSHYVLRYRLLSCDTVASTTIVKYDYTYRYRPLYMWESKLLP